MSKTIAVITGATSGLGQLAAIALAKQGWHLVLTARNEKRAETAKTIMKDIVPNAKMDFFFGDLSLMEDVQRIGKEIKAVYPQIDLLINNAGLHAFEQRITKEGFPEMIAVNYLAPWLLTHILLPSLSNTKHARIVNVASEASRNHGELILPEDLMDTKEFTAKESSALYGKTKLLDIMFTAKLGRKLGAGGVTINALDPGFNVTGLGRELGFSAVLSKILNFLHIGDPRKGANIIVRLATETQYEGVTGGYFKVGTGKPIIPIHPAGDHTMQDTLWDATENLLRQRGFLA